MTLHAGHSIPVIITAVEKNEILFNTAAQSAAEAAEAAWRLDFIESAPRFARQRAKGPLVENQFYWFSTALTIPPTKLLQNGGNDNEQLLKFPLSDFRKRLLKSLGKYGHMRKQYLQAYRPGLYNSLLLSGTLYAHLLEIDRTVRKRLELMMPEMAKAAEQRGN